MMFRLSSLIAPLLAARALAAPAPEVAGMVAQRQATCPTVTRWEAYWATTVYLSTSSVAVNVNIVESPTATTTSTQVYEQYIFETVVSPAVTTIPATTTTPYVATETSTIVWQTLTETVTSPGYAPSESCQVKSSVEIIPGRTTATVTSPLYYDVHYNTYTYHVATVTEKSTKSMTRTVTRPGSTSYLTTVTQPQTWTSVDLTYVTETKTVWAKGCQTLVCVP